MRNQPAAISLRHLRSSRGEGRAALLSILTLLGWLVAGSLAALAALAGSAHAEIGRFTGETKIRLLDQHRAMGLGVTWQGGLDATGLDATGLDATGRFASEAPLLADAEGLNADELAIDQILQRGGFVLHTPEGSIDLTDFELRRSSDRYDFELLDKYGERWLRAVLPHFDRGESGRDLSIRHADLIVAPELASFLARPELAGVLLGELEVELSNPSAAPLSQSSGGSLVASSEGSFLPAECGPSFGPDVDVQLSSLSVPQQLARDAMNGRVALAPSAELVNAGSTAVEWGRAIAPDGDPAVARAGLRWIGQHPLLVLHLYRIDGNVIEQIGLSDAKHAFFSVNTGCNCAAGQLLGVGCGDVYSAGTNNQVRNLGPRDEITANTADWTSLGSFFDGTPVDDVRSNPAGADDGFSGRLVVDETTLSTAGARYFAEGWYLAKGDVDIFNSMAHREVVPSLNGSTWVFTDATGVTGSTNGSILDVYMPPGTAGADRSNAKLDTGAGQLQLAAIASDNGNGTHTYDYALMNFDYDNQVERFSVPLPPGAAVTATAFRGFGETPGPDWVVNITPSEVEWIAPNGEELDWGRMLGFSLTVDVAPSPSVITLDGSVVFDQQLIGGIGPAPLPANDDSADATDAIVGVNVGTLANASPDGASTNFGGTLPDVWYRVTAANTGTLRMYTCGSFAQSGVDTLISAHSAIPGTPGNELGEIADFPPGMPNLPAACVDPPDSLLDIPVTQGQVVFIRVAQQGMVGGGFVLLVEQPPIANDDAANAAPIAAGSVMGTLVDATPDGSSTNFSGVADVWYQVTAGSAGTLVVDTCGSAALGSDTILSLERASDGLELAENDDALYFDPLVRSLAGPASGACDGVASASPLDSAAAIVVTGGDQVRIRVGHEPNSAPAPFVLNVAGPGATSTSLVARDVSFLDEIFINYFPPGAPVELFWGSTGNTCTASNGWFGSRAPGAGQQETVSAGGDDTTYTLTCDGTGGQSVDSVTVRVDPVALNDDCFDASSLGTPFTTTPSAFFAGIEAGEPIPSCVPDDNSSLWYEVTPGATGTLAISTIGSNYDTVLSVHDPAVCFGSGFELACSDDAGGLAQSRVVVATNAGNPFLVRVAAFGNPGTTNDFDIPDQLVLSADFVTPAANDDCVDATILAEVDVDMSDPSAATVEGNEPASGCVAFPEATVWYRVTPSQNGSLSFSTAGSGYDTVVAVFDGSPGCGQLFDELGCNDDAQGTLQSEVTVAATAGVPLLVRVSAFPGALPTDLSFAVPEPQGMAAAGTALGMLGALLTLRRRSKMRP